MDYRIGLSIISIAIAVVSYSIYFKNIFSGHTKPHAFTWLIWGILQSIGFAAQIFGHGGPGAWPTGATALICLIIAGIAFYKGEIKFVRLDWFSLTGAILAIILWLITKNPLMSVILITLCDVFGYLPTFRKTYHQPNQEPLKAYLLSSVKEIFSLFALTNYNFITGFYITTVTVLNIIFVLFALIRRRQLGQKEKS